MINFQSDILPLKNELYRMALRITMNPAEAEDVVQETMMKVWNKRDSWEQIDSIEAVCPRGPPASQRRSTRRSRR